MAGVHGKGYLVQIDIAAVATTILGQTGMTISRTMAPVEVTNKDDAYQKTFIAGDQSTTVDFDGLTLAADPGWVQALVHEAANSSAIFTVIRPEDADLFEFTGWITSITETASRDGAAELSVSVQASGAITKLWVA